VEIFWRKIVFIELVSPSPRDILCTRDRVKVRVAEPGSTGRFWINLVFKSEEELAKFSTDLSELIKKPREVP
jgi:hypothetical protein